MHWYYGGENGSPGKNESLITDDKTLEDSTDLRTTGLVVDWKYASLS